MDIEEINLVSDDDDVQITGVRSRKGNKEMKPIRLTRHEHKERVVLVNTDSSADAVKADPDAPAEGAEGEEDAEGDAEDSLFVKPDVDDTMELDGSPAVRGTGGRFSVGSIDLDAPISEPLTAEEIRKAKSKPAPKAKKPVLQTAEDTAEYERQLEDIAVLSAELGGLSTAAKEGEDVEMGEDGQPKPKEGKLEGRVYLFQFPPILPQLRKEGEPVVKTDAADVDMTDIPANGEAIEIADLPDIKPETAGVDAIAEHALDQAALRAKIEHENALVQEPGRIGKLIVRKSGKVEFSWGGTSLALGRGAPYEFLTKGVIVTGMQKEGKLGRDVTKEEEISMAGTGMGKVMGKFVATPDWEKLFK